MNKKVSPYAILFVIFLTGAFTNLVALVTIALFAMVAFVDYSIIVAVFLLLAIVTKNNLFIAITVISFLFMGAKILFGPRKTVVVIQDDRHN